MKLLSGWALKDTLHKSSLQQCMYISQQDSNQNKVSGNTTKFRIQIKRNNTFIT